MADEDVKFRLGFEDSPEAYQQLEKLASAVEETQSRISDMMADIGSSAAKAAQMASAAGEAMQSGGGMGPQAQQDAGASAMAWLEDWQDARAQDLQNAQQHVMAIDQLAESQVATLSDVSDEFASMWDQVNANIDDVRDNAGSIEASISVVGDEDLYRLADEAQELQDNLNAVDASKAVAQVDQLNRELEQAATEAEEVARMLEGAGFSDLAQEAAIEGQQRVEEAAQNAKKAMDEEAERQKKFADDMLAANDKLEESWINAARSIGGAVRGIAMLSASQSEDVQAAIEMLLQVQGAIDVAINSADAIKNVTRAMRDYSAARDLAIQGVTSAGSQAATRAAGSAVGGVASGAAGGAAGGVATAGGMAIGGGAAALGSAIAAAIGGTLFGLFSAFSSGTSAGRFGIGGGAEQGSFVDTVGGSDWNPFSWLIAADKKWERDNKEAMTERIQIERDLLLKQKELNAQRLANQMELIQLEQSAAMQALNARQSFEMIADDSPQNRLSMLNERDALLTSQMQGTQGILGEAESTGNYNLAEQSLASIRQMEEERQEIIKERLTIEKQIADEQTRGADEAIRSLQQQLDMRQKEADAIEESLMTAKERFAALSEAEQQEAINVAEMIRAGNANNLTDEQRSLARRVGTEELMAGAREADIAEADTAGFDRFFGNQERQRLGATQEQVQSLLTGLEITQDFKADIRVNFEGLEEQLREEFAKNQERIKELVERANAQVQERQGRQLSMQSANSSNVG